MFSILHHRAILAVLAMTAWGDRVVIHDEEYAVASARVNESHDHALLQLAAPISKHAKRLAVSPAPPSIKVFQWNPHWECVSGSHWISHHCKDGALASLRDVLQQGIDFANVVELHVSYKPPDGFDILEKTCGYDRTSLIWNSSKWELSNYTAGGCMESRYAWPWRDDRPFIVAVFRRRGMDAADAGEPQTVTVVGAHFPHGHLHNLVGIDRLGYAITSSGVGKVIFAADVNLESWTTSASIMARMGVESAEQSLGTELLRSCCKNDGFRHTYDRVMANFGTSMKTDMLHDPLPWFAWTGTWAFHKGIIAEIV